MKGENMKSKVYFTDFRTYSRISLVEKFEKLISASDMDRIDFSGKFVAIKLHFGELGNLAFLRHNYAQALAKHIKARGGIPFLTDCNTLYTGSRTNAVDHIYTAYANGFNPVSCPDAPIIIADGLKGTDEVDLPVPGGYYCPTAKIGRAIADADIIISLNHFKGHESAGFGGAMKNLGMGCGSRAGKKDMHTSEKPLYNEDLCVGCESCAKVCAHEAQSFKDGKMVFYEDKCAGCGRCLEACPTGALSTHTADDFRILNRKIAEYTKAILVGKPNYHISLVVDVSPFCDCYGCNDTPIVPDVGMFASGDPVAIDKACIDAVNAQHPMEHSHLTDADNPYDKNLDNIYNNCKATDWKDAIRYAQELGLGNADYELVQCNIN